MPRDIRDDAMPPTPPEGSVRVVPRNEEERLQWQRQDEDVRINNGTCRCPACDDSRARAAERERLFREPYRIDIQDVRMQRVVNDRVIIDDLRLHDRTVWVGSDSFVWSPGTSSSSTTSVSLLDTLREHNIEYTSEMPNNWPFPSTGDEDKTFLNTEDGGLYNHPYILLEKSDNQVWVLREDFHALLATSPTPPLFASISQGSWFLEVYHLEPLSYNKLVFTRRGVSVWWALDSFRSSSVQLDPGQDSVTNRLLVKCEDTGERCFTKDCVYLKHIDGSETWVKRSPVRNVNSLNVDDFLDSYETPSYQQFLEGLEISSLSADALYRVSSTSRPRNTGRGVGYTVTTLQEIVDGTCILLWRMRLGEMVEDSWNGVDTNVGGGCVGYLEAYRNVAQGDFVDDVQCPETGFWFLNNENLSVFQTGRLPQYYIDELLEEDEEYDEEDSPDYREGSTVAGDREHRIWNYSKDVVAYLKLKPPFFKGRDEPKQPENVPYFGVELEVQPHNLQRGSAVNRVYKALGDNNVILKDDSSIGGNGFEIVTAPGTLQYHRELWPTFFEKSREYLRSWNTTTCGLHVHISKSSLTQAQQDMYVHFFDKPENLPFVQTVAGRSIEEYAKANHEKAIKDQDGAKYRACNIGKAATLEVRIFRGTCHPNGFFKALEFVASLHEYVLTLNAEASDDKRSEALRFDNYLQWLKSKGTQYPALMKWLKFRKFYTKSKGVVSKNKARDMMAPVLKRMEELKSKPSKKSKDVGPTATDYSNKSIAEDLLAYRLSPQSVISSLCTLNSLEHDASNETLLVYIKGDAAQKLLDKRTEVFGSCSGHIRNLNHWYISWDYRISKAFLTLCQSRSSEEVNEIESIRALYRTKATRNKKLKLYDLIDTDIDKDFDETIAS